jgi:hypothetical protein
VDKGIKKKGKREKGKKGKREKGKKGKREKGGRSVKTLRLNAIAFNLPA